MTLQNYGAWAFNYIAVFCTDTKSLGDIGVHLNFFIIGKVIKWAELVLF